MAESQNRQVDAGFSGTGPAGLSLGLGRIVVPKTQTFPWPLGMCSIFIVVVALEVYRLIKLHTLHGKHMQFTSQVLICF